LEREQYRLPYRRGDIPRLPQAWEAVCALLAAVCFFAFGIATLWLTPSLSTEAQRGSSAAGAGAVIVSIAITTWVVLPYVRYCRAWRAYQRRRAQVVAREGH
jgi:hypothetical protein